MVDDFRWEWWSWWKVVSKRRFRVVGELAGGLVVWEQGVAVAAGLALPSHNMLDLFGEQTSQLTSDMHSYEDGLTKLTSELVTSSARVEHL